jgi:diaminopropionate ammonia-lyase
VTRYLLNPNSRLSLPLREPVPHPLSLHRRMPGYAPSPLHDLPALAVELGIEKLWVKDESSRFGLPAFKILGASWATYRTLAERLQTRTGDDVEPWQTLEDLRDRFEALQPLTLATATDGNHGRAVARMAKLFGLPAQIYVPRGTAEARIAAIESEGATVTVVDGSYDDAVELAASTAGPTVQVISDTAWEGYLDVPARVIEGYATIFAEIDTALEEANEAGPTIAFVQVGVGALAAAMVAHYRNPTALVRPVLVSLEPETAACAFESAAAGEPVTVAGPHTSMMVGMNCGTPSMLAWPLMRDGVDLFIALPDAPAAEAMRRLASEGIVSGETGASGLAALFELLRDPAAEPLRDHLGIGPGTRALVISTEGATDPANYERIVGKPPSAVHR